MGGSITSEVPQNGVILLRRGLWGLSQSFQGKWSLFLPSPSLSYSSSWPPGILGGCISSTSRLLKFIHPLMFSLQRFWSCNDTKTSCWTRSSIIFPQYLAFYGVMPLVSMQFTKLSSCGLLLQSYFGFTRWYGLLHQCLKFNCIMYAISWLSVAAHPLLVPHPSSLASLESKCFSSTFFTWLFVTSTLIFCGSVRACSVSSVMKSYSAWSMNLLSVRWFLLVISNFLAISPPPPKKQGDQSDLLILVSVANRSLLKHTVYFYNT